MQVVLLRVGIDSGCGGIQGPLFRDGSFEFVCMPDTAGAEQRTYGNTRGARSGRPLLDFFPAARRPTVANQSIHIDPEFDGFTYGDPTTPKKGLRRLRRGDLLILYCGLQGFGFESPPALYVVAYFRIALAGEPYHLGEEVVRREFASNFHVKHPAVYRKDRERLLLLKGGPGSRLLSKALKISEEGSDRTGKPLKVLCPSMREVFGDLGGLNSLQRSTPRWVSPTHVERAASFVTSLE
jgi:hypothetical protein